MFEIGIHNISLARILKGSISRSWLSDRGLSDFPTPVNSRTPSSSSGRSRARRWNDDNKGNPELLDRYYSEYRGSNDYLILTFVFFLGHDLDYARISPVFLGKDACKMPRHHMCSTLSGYSRVTCQHRGRLATGFLRAYERIREVSAGDAVSQAITSGILLTGSKF
ncbi:hypothetical protein Hypma_000996 [Hypsizygus marmoreus]|uniref:Uncharacterized protein n=1 Tax=Hypsizygus marmoreus TaxID=39966 RepID=A0A369JDI6_HYPMA|nr:hypothetical protein Hypma_000996 [Hypsizygus marmoreus]